MFIRNTIKRLFSMLLVCAIVVGVVPVFKEEVHAASENIVTIAESYKGKNLAQTKTAMRGKGFSMWKPEYSGDWCAWFVSNCARQAGISTSVITNTNSCDRTWTKNKGSYRPAKAYGGSYTPKPGDLVYFTWSRTDYAYHIGIVKSVSGNTVTTIEGNSGGGTGVYIVRENKWSLSDSQVLGFVETKQNINTAQKVFYIKYKGNGADSGDMSTYRTNVIYGQKNPVQTLAKNRFSKTGAKFAGWAAYRESDKKWVYKNTSTGTTAWYKQGSQPSGWVYDLYRDQNGVHSTSPVDGDTVWMYAQWTPNTFTIRYDANGANGYMQPTTVTYDKSKPTALRKNTFTKEGYIFRGWAAYRESDQMWLWCNPNNGEERWATRANKPSGWIYSLYRDEHRVYGTTKVDKDTVYMFAQWEESFHVWDSGKVTGEATASKTGEKLYTCKNCGKIKTETIPKLKANTNQPLFRRLAGYDRYGTAFSIGEGYLEDSRQELLKSVIVAYGDNFPDALSASYLSAKYKAPIILTRTTKEKEVVSWINKNVKSKGNVLFVGGKEVVPNSLRHMLENEGYNVRRVSGNDRYGTNIAVLKMVGIKAKSEVLVCDGRRFENALIASATGRPMLLTAENNLTRDQKSFLEGIKGKGIKFTILGDTNSVSYGIEKALGNYGSVARIKAANEDAMSVKVAKRYWAKGPKEAFLATSKNFPDALAGGPVCIANKSPIFLINNNSYMETAKYLKGIRLNKVTAFGGIAVVSDSLVKKVVNIE